MGRTTHGIALKSHALTPIETLRLQHKNSLGTRPVSTTRANPPQGGDAKPRDLPQGSAGLPKETTERKARRSKAEMPWRGGLVVSGPEPRGRTWESDSFPGRCLSR